MKQKTKAIIYLTLFALFICGEITAQDFNGHWGTNDSNYYLTIKDTVFSTYKFVPALDEKNDLIWDRVSSPGVEKFIHQKDNTIKTNYYIVEDRYQVYVTYTLIDDETLKAEFKGSLRNEFYYDVIKYKKIKFEGR